MIRPLHALATLLVLWAPVVSAQDSAFSQYAQRAMGLYFVGEYAEAEEYCERVAGYNVRDANVSAILLDAELAQGKYAEAAATASQMVERFEGYIPMQVKALEALRAGGQYDEAAELVKSLDALAKNANPKTLNASERVALGKVALMLGAEPKMVLAQFYQKARKAEPDHLDASLAAAELALDKSDYALAAKILGEARSKIGPLPRIMGLLARAHSPSDREKAESLIDLALERNPRHVPAILLRAEHQFDAENYEQARELLTTARSVNPHSPRAWALEAAIAHLLDETQAAKDARSKALAHATRNPEVDFLIGKKVSQKRRFDEGSVYLRQALELEPKHLGARKTLGQNLLRLGKEEEGWQLISGAQESDKYDVETFNLMLLHDQLQKFEVIEADGFMVRMTPEEAAIYGKRVITLLKDAREKLCSKYGFTPSGKVVVDFFPDQQDFAVRTLGIPGGLGIVGACFGNVIAMNSPGSAGAMGTNWESTLWHEYCHTVTLGATRNRIPRWFTEGISVYEERQRDVACGHKMTSEFRRRILTEDGLIPIGNLSAALTAFNDPQTISFAYYQSSILFEYMVQTYGPKAVRQVLADLRENASMEKVAARRLSKLSALDASFAKFAKAKARKVAPKADWQVPEDAAAIATSPEAVAAYLKKHPNNVWALSRHSLHLLGEGQWQAAKKPATKLIALYPDYIGPGNGYATLGLACRNLEDPKGEAKALRELAKRDADASTAFLRLLEIDIAQGDWAAVETDARKQLAVNPLLREPHRALGIAAQEQEKTEAAISAFESLLQLDPINPADTHFRLGQLYQGSDQKAALRHVLMALEDAPRFRPAHELLLSLQPIDAP